VARAIVDNAAVFARDKPDPARERQLIGAVAGKLQEVSALIDDPDVREAMRRVGQSSSVASFATSASPAPGQTVARQAFDGSYSGQWADAKGTVLEIGMVLTREGQIVRGTYDFGLGTVELGHLFSGITLGRCLAEVESRDFAYSKRGIPRRSVCRATITRIRASMWY